MMGPGESRYNSSPIMSGSRYALVAYVRNPVGEFVEKLRRELHPELPQMAAHLTLLPPRILKGSESSAIQALEELAATWSRSKWLWARWRRLFR